MTSVRCNCLLDHPPRSFLAICESDAQEVLQTVAFLAAQECATLFATLHQHFIQLKLLQEATDRQIAADLTTEYRAQVQHLGCSMVFTVFIRAKMSNLGRDMCVSASQARMV